MKSFTDRVAVVTGAGSGIGRALAVELARRGCDVAVTDVHVDRLDAVRDDIVSLGRKATVHGFDVADRAAWPGFVDDVLQLHGHVDLLVNNAGVALTGRFDQCSLDDLDWQLRVNLYGVMYGCHFLLPTLLQRPDAHIVNLSSIFGIVSMPENSAYCMSKHAVRTLTETLEMELYRTNVRVTSVHPGAIATRIVRDGRAEEGVDRERANQLIDGGMPPERAARIIADGVAADRRRILVGSDAKGLALLRWLLPQLHRTLIARYFFR
ncbi:MAG: SDR family oxidoreductase [Myxococcota bacterium]